MQRRGSSLNITQLPEVPSYSSLCLDRREMVSIHVKRKIFHVESKRAQNLQVKQMFWDAKRCQKLKITTGAPILLNKSGKGSKFTYWRTLAQLPNHREMDNLYLWFVSHWEKPTKLPLLEGLPRSFLGRTQSSIWKILKPSVRRYCFKNGERKPGSCCRRKYRYTHPWVLITVAKTNFQTWNNIILSLVLSQLAVSAKCNNKTKINTTDELHCCPLEKQCLPIITFMLLPLQHRKVRPAAGEL